jgi:Zn finger protein HypA/HybF involved in hydrogenase expression
MDRIRTLQQLCASKNEQQFNRKDLYVADCLHCFHKERIRKSVEKEKKLNCPLCGKQTIGFKNGNQYILGNHVTVKGNAKISRNTKIIGDIKVDGGM